MCTFVITKNLNVWNNSNILMVTSYRCMVLADGWDKGASLSPSPSIPSDESKTHGNVCRR